MTWIKFTHTGGTSYLNLDQYYTFEETAPAVLTFYDAGSGSATNYTFSSASALATFVKKLESLSRVIDIDQLSIQA
jgi:hypothetical protein